MSKFVQIGDQKDKNMFVMERIVNGWGNRAKIRGDLINIPFIMERDDFVESLLPFHEHPLYKKLSYEQKRNCLSCGWIIYNEKTLMIESEVVNPACKSIIDGNIVGLNTNEARLAACETMIDESYHMLIVEKANQITKSLRELSHIKYPQFHLSKSLHRAYDDCNEVWMKPLLQVAAAMVTEILISDYLSKLSTNEDIQPMNKITVATHLHDELAHSKLFATMLYQFYHALSPKQKTFFSSSIAKAISWFSSNELDLWKSVLEQCGISKYREIIEDCKLSDINTIQIDYTTLISVLKTNEILENNYIKDLFSNSGII
ncbi:MAG: diiron oxygenase [Burkholderiales bacterium]|nr:diiron oxygenase [Burkholderiales bacterium]